MTITSNLTTNNVIQDGCLLVNGKIIFTQVPQNVIVSPAPFGSSFIGATSPTPSSRHVFSLGVLQGYKFLSLFRFKIWWMIPRVGNSGSEVPIETQMLLLEAKEESTLLDKVTGPSTDDTFYILVLPVLEGAFRASLQGTSTNELEFCVESGDPDVQTSHVSESVFINSGENPFELMKNSIKILAEHKGTFSHIENKKMPAHLDWFGWCTWDAFYQDVNPEGIREGLESLSQGGCAPRFLIIDDGWQDTCNEFRKEGEENSEGTQFAIRLRSIKENEKFQRLSSDDYTNLPEFIKFMKERYGLKYVYMWHALVGYWGGLLPSSESLKKYNPKIVYPVQSPGNVGNLRDVAMDSIERYGIGLIDPEKINEFYNDYHSYLASIDVDGIKVDIQNVVETIGSGYGGRVTLTALHQRALEESVARNFKSNNLISCMSHNSDSIFSSTKSAVARASEDFMPREPTLQTLHIVSVSFNSLFLGEIVVPDWDMFQSKHDTADFHAASRAIGGCAVYVSDKPGNHDFNILRKLILPDGSILRARYAGRPTRDCLFKDPVMDGKSLMKIWNMNKLSGIIGVFNCQGAGNWPLKQNSLDNPTPKIISDHVSPNDVEFLGEVAGDKWHGDCAVYSFNSGILIKVPDNGKVEVSLSVLTCELYTICPITVIDEAVHFAPIGLIDMYNSGGAVEALSSTTGPNGCIVKIEVRGCGCFGAYSSTKPRHCTVDMMEEEFTYNPEEGLLTMKLEGGCQVKNMEFMY
ncbi:probable galactinol--sucrose galactosyltransferase 2 isoform X2 [Beta vulgaris subsp. vulgaris]|uniref:probable galactinol--sucrose galactosyltransferase 2 isoform X2 n=1 Tax=Beta vulgaris subsp. vulgaris TaxID=3555 RepID=UPI0020369AD5|nr:probable galactinol--sucrose galactosyltransferase 2 isoform X2 [Beta vulgaris subsp. vulgaris]